MVIIDSAVSALNLKLELENNLFVILYFQ